jgi:hypothetical protein
MMQAEQDLQSNTNLPQFYTYDIYKLLPTYGGAGIA